ncbi:MAG: hypothetical protein C0594_02705 [Marinilabiliales bacterium]|nr:MAG: hypothetical protein C0594_02705 [Marinilabiliales bacterium]
MVKTMHFFRRNYRTIFAFLLLFALVLISADLFARVGGGGGSSRSSGGDGDLIGIAIYIISMIPFPYNMIVLAIVIVLYFLAKKKMRQQTVLNQLPTGEGPSKARGYDNFAASNPDFNETEFKKNVEDSFIAIQNAWQDKDMGKVRHFISDGMYQRLNTQFKMMDILKQKNTIDKLNVKNVYIDKIESDGQFDIIHVAIHASIVDKFISEKYSKLNSGGSEEFVEYWSYMKKRGVEAKDLFHTNNCPNCGGELPKKANDVSKCEFCGTVMNSPEYGWILAEITQADDYITSNSMVMKDSNLKGKIGDLVANNPDFSVQLIEDKVSNGYLQIETARVMNDNKLLRRFVSDEYFERKKDEFKDNDFVYNRLYLNDVSLLGIGQKDKKNQLLVSVKVSYQKVRLMEKKVDILDPVVTCKTEIVRIERDMQAAQSKGSAYTHTCPSCGGSVEDTLDTKCPYCGNPVNSSSTDWIIADVMSMEEYYNYYSANAAAFSIPVKPEKTDVLYKVRDYAFNNVLLMIAVDGVFDAEEKKFAESLAKKWGYNVDKIQPMFQMAQNGKLVLRMPEDPKQRKKIYEMMNKAAQVDGNISEEEQNLLNTVRDRYIAA